MVVPCSNSGALTMIQTKQNDYIESLKFLYFLKRVFFAWLNVNRNQCLSLINEVALYTHIVYCDWLMTGYGSLGA